MRHDASRGLHQWLNDDRRQRLGVLDERLFELAQVKTECRARRHANRQPIRIGRRQPDDLKQQRPEHFMKPGDAPDADASQCVAVIGVVPGQIFCPLRLWTGSLPPILKRHLQRNLNCRRAIVREKDVIEARRGSFDQPASELDGCRMHRAEQRDMRHLVELLANGRVDHRMSVPVHIAPQAAHAVDIFAAIATDQRAAMSSLNKERLILSHLSEGMPDMLPIPAL
jgi:hypothetical protein